MSNGWTSNDRKMAAGMKIELGDPAAELRPALDKEALLEEHRRMNVYELYNEARIEIDRLQNLNFYLTLTCVVLFFGLISMWGQGR